MLCHDGRMLPGSKLLCTLIGCVAVCGCSSPSPTRMGQTSPQPGASNTPPNPLPTSSASAAPPTTPPPTTSSSARPAATIAPGQLPTSAAPSFSVQCIEASTGRTSQSPRACILRGRIRTVKRLDTLPDATWLFDGFTPAVAHQAFDVDITPDNNISCATPLDAKDKETRLPEADFPDLAMAGRVRILGGERISSELVTGKRICGWSRFVTRPGQGYPSGWEGELSSGDAKDKAWKLLGAYSMYLNPTSNKHLWRSWSFVREGAARRIPIDEGGAFIAHDAVRIQHKKQSAVSPNGEEVSLKTSDGTFAVLATSDLTAGNVPVFVGQHDGFAFAAVRSEP